MTFCNLALCKSEGYHIKLVGVTCYWKKAKLGYLLLTYVFELYKSCMKTFSH
jgi:hypothetical protein